MNDRTPMPFGKHKGQALEECPASYLLWLADELSKEPKDRVRAELRAYVDANRAALEKEAEEAGWEKE